MYYQLLILSSLKNITFISFICMINIHINMNDIRDLVIKAFPKPQLEATIFLLFIFWNTISPQAVELNLMIISSMSNLHYETSFCHHRWNSHSLWFLILNPSVSLDFVTHVCFSQITNTSFILFLYYFVSTSNHIYHAWSSPL